MHTNSSSGTIRGRSLGTRIPTGRETVLVAIGQGALMILGGVLAILVAQIFGKNAKTDAFFAAYGVYSVGLTFGQTFRLTAISRLIKPGETEPVTRLLGAVMLMALVLGVPMVLLAGPLAHVLVTVDPGNVAAAALRILWIALTCQLLAAMLATVLAIRAAFVAIGLTTLVSGAISVGVFLLLNSSVGILSAPIGLATSALWLSMAFTATLLHRGWRPSTPGRRSIREMYSEAAGLMFASGIFIGANLAYVVCVAIAARQGKGEATIFAYAYVLAAMLVGVTANVTAMMRSPALIASSTRTTSAAATGVWSFRFTLVLAGPVVAMVLLVGRPVIGFALGHGFNKGNVSAIVITLVFLSGWILASAAGIFAIIELLARSELRRLAYLAVALVVAVLVLAILGSIIGGVEGIAGGLSIATVAVALVQLRWAFGAQWLDGAKEMLGASAREAAVLVSAFGPAALLLVAVSEDAASRVAAGLLATVLVLIASRVAWPSEFQAVVGLARRSPLPTDAPHSDEVETVTV